MIEALCILFCVALATGIPVDETVMRKINPRITGTGYSEITAVPYQAQLIRDKETLFCGATIIDSEWLLSASHCFIDPNIQVTVLTGSTFRLKGEQSLIEKVYTHPGFQESDLDNDICLIKLQKPLQLNENQTSIPLLYTELMAGQSIQISGYGRESDFSNHSPVIKVAHVPVIDKTVCSKRYLKVNDTLTNSMFCAGDGKEDACLGDSGGPAVFNGLLVGVISAGRLCKSREFPGVYTKLSIFRSWIENTMKADKEKNTKKPKLKLVSSETDLPSIPVPQAASNPNRPAEPMVIGSAKSAGSLPPYYPFGYPPNSAWGRYPYQREPNYYSPPMNSMPRFQNYIPVPPPTWDTHGSYTQGSSIYLQDSITVEKHDVHSNYFN